MADVNTGPLARGVIPLRVINRRASRAHVLGNCASWRCICGHPEALHGRSGRSGGPTPDTVVVCPQCGRVYFVIPTDRSFGPPIEVVQLYGMPAPAAVPAAESASSDAA